MNTSTSLKIAIAAGGVALLLLGFLAGQAFERIHLRHEAGWQAHYQQNFFGPRRGMMAPPMAAHVILGKLLTVQNNTLTVQDRSGTEQSITMTDKTIIRKDRDTATRDDLKVGGSVAIFGHPNGQGQIEADLIRLFPTR